MKEVLPQEQGRTERWHDTERLRGGQGETWAAQYY